MYPILKMVVLQWLDVYAYHMPPKILTTLMCVVWYAPGWVNIVFIMFPSGLGVVPLGIFLRLKPGFHPS